MSTQTDYRYIEAWGQMLNSDRRYVWDQVQKARQDNAPADATYWSVESKRWHTFSEVTSENTRSVIESILKGRKP